ncbi:hypothetical protein QYM36_015029 [Artemia franciscana]|uniref:SET domain-containing protein n=1 Tax=Artemia franciscana TaxID=6661 RepID=A0AA88KX09_ARTSF|nr:hypothetical protein QYM36_015029 [Artemia franciscana]
MTKEIETIIREESSIMTMPAPGPILNAPEHTLNAPKHTLTAPKPTLTAPELTLTDPKPTLTVAGPTLTAPGLTLTAPGTHPASLIAPEDDSRNPSMTLAVSKDVKGKKPRNFFTICQFCRRSFYKLDKHLLAKKGSCSKNTNGEFWSVKKQRKCMNWPRMSLQRGLRTSHITLHGFCKALSAMTGIYFDPLNLPDRALSFEDTRPVTVPAPRPANPEGTCTHTNTHTAHVAGPSTSALPQQSPPVLETDLFSGKQLSLSSQIRRRRVSEESDPEDVVDSDEGGSLYAPEIPEDESSEEEEEKSELRSEYYKKDWNWTSDIRKKMQKHGLYDIYTTNVKTEEEAKKMAYGIELMKKFEKWSAEYDQRNLKAGVEKFMAPVITRLTRNRLVEEVHTNLTAYLCFLVSFMYGHRPGVPENMTVTEFLNRRYVEEENMFVILVEKHKTASIKSAGVALSARAEEILKKISEKRGIGADLTEALTEASLQMAIRRLGYQDTVPSLEEVQQTYSRFRIPKLFPSEPLVDDYLTQCVLNQSWPGMTVAQSLNKGAGQGVYATIPFYKNQVVVEIHGKRMATIEANRLFRSLLGEDDGSNYFLTVDQDVTIDAREEACACHPHQQCFGRLVNHKANEDGPNLKSKALVVDGLKRPFLVATRDITAGEELCFDYGVRPGQFNEGYEQMFLLPEKPRKRKR